MYSIKLLLLQYQLNYYVVYKKIKFVGLQQSIVTVS